MESWWDRNALSHLAQFSRWTGDFAAPSKVAARRHVAACGYQSLLDCGCGLCTEFFGYQHARIPISYYGIDSCQDLIHLGRRRGVPNLCKASVEALPFPDASMDVVFLRHVLEHLEHYRRGLCEAIRVGVHEVVVVWFLTPGPAPDRINYDAVENLYRNRYNRVKVERWVLSCPKVASLSWEKVGAREAILHINLRASAVPPTSDLGHGRHSNGWLPLLP